MADTNPLAAMPLAESLANNMNESLQWMSRIWSSAAAGAAPSPLPSGLPSMMVPTLDPKELDKRISDLRSVQHWLDMNRALLHTTIQTLEMQRNAIVALQSMATAAQGGSSTAAREAESASAAAAQPAAESAAALAFNPAQWWNALSEQFARVAATAAAEPGRPEAAGDAPPDPAAPLQRAADPPRDAGQAAPSSAARPGRRSPGQ
jgi:hypothetical protein